VWLDGERLHGGYHLVRTTGGDEKSWLMMRMKPETGERLMRDWCAAQGGSEALLTPECRSKRGQPSRLGGAETLRSSETAALPQGDIPGTGGGREAEGDAGRPPRVAPAGEIGAAAPLPGWVTPMVAEAGEQAFVDADWLFERKLDGERCLAFRHGEEVRLWSRAHQLLNGQYPELVAALLDQPADDFVADGEIVAFEGRATSFPRLQRRMHVIAPSERLIREVPVSYYLFDLLYVRGYDLRGLPLKQRKSLLRSAFLFEEPLRWTPYRVGDGEAAFADACRRSWEGVVAKRASGPYSSRRSGDWLKLKCVQEQEFVIGGYTPGKGSRSGFGALLVGYYGKDLTYAGKVGTGFNERTLRDLGAELATLQIERQPFAGPPIAEKGARWVQPVRVAQVVFDGWTDDGRLWHARFLGLRRDKNPREVVRENGTIDREPVPGA
jgi:bifunctional non-homologous end joining protein LigD